MSTVYRAEADLEIYQGADFEFFIYVLDDNEAAVDLTGYTAMMEIRPEPGGEVLSTASTTNGKIVIDGPTGEVGITLGYADTSLLPAGTWKYDVFIQSPGAATRRCIATGDVLVAPKITEMT